MNKSEVRVVRGPTLRHKIKTVVGVMPAETLVRHHCVPHRNLSKAEGYQRNPTNSRVNELASELKRQSVDLPTSVLLNVRDVKEDELLTKSRNDNYILNLDPEKASGEHRLYVVDGQHRISALKKAIEEHGADIQNVKIPFVCMLGASEFNEMEQFHVVNSNAKSVRTDLALDLLKSRAELDPDFAHLVEMKGKKWQVDAQVLTERLAKSSSVWENKIRLPNEPSRGTTVPSASFVRSLKPLLAQPNLFKNIKTVERQAQVIDAYWNAIRRVLPKAFEEPTSYSIQKGVGVEVLHAILPVVIVCVRATDGGSLFKAESYIPTIDNALKDIEGLNGDGTIVQGEMFWRSGHDGAAGTYTSTAGKRRLTEYLLRLLPEIDV